MKEFNNSIKTVEQVANNISSIVKERRKAANDKSSGASRHDLSMWLTIVFSVLAIVAIVIVIFQIFKIEKLISVNNQEISKNNNKLRQLCVPKMGTATVMGRKICGYYLVGDDKDMLFEVIASKKDSLCLQEDYIYVNRNRISDVIERGSFLALFRKNGQYFIYYFEKRGNLVNRPGAPSVNKRLVFPFTRENFQKIDSISNFMLIGPE